MYRGEDENYVSSKSRAKKHLCTSVMYAGFFVEGGPANVWGSDFWGSEGNVTIGKSSKIWVIFQNYALKLIKIWNWENSRKNEKFPKVFLIFWRNYGENKEYNMNRL